MSIQVVTVLEEYVHAWYISIYICVTLTNTMADWNWYGAFYTCSFKTEKESIESMPWLKIMEIMSSTLKFLRFECSNDMFGAFQNIKVCVIGFNHGLPWCAKPWPEGLM